MPDRSGLNITQLNKSSINNRCDISLISDGSQMDPVDVLSIFKSEASEKYESLNKSC